MTTSQETALEGIRVLTESEIQDRLYGRYLGRRPGPKGPGQSPRTETDLLSSEVIRLRRELLSLRQERERLERRLTQPGSLWNLLGKGLGILLLVIGIGYPVGVRLLQASPTGPEPSPYTVQVGVYDVRPAAERALNHLREFGYPAFWVELSRRDGRPRYRIYVGQFVTKEEASLEREKLIADPRFKDAFVRIQ